MAVQLTRADRPAMDPAPERYPMTYPTQLRRIRWIVRLALTLGVAASVAANVLHARDNAISQTIAAWPPLALLLTVELISRVPVHRRALAAIRIAATAIIAAIAAWVSYWHMAGVTARYGESPTSAHLMPICVDGLIVVASISLVELAARIRALDAQPAAATQTSPTAATKAPAAAAHTGVPGRNATAAARPAKRPAERTPQATTRAAKATPAKKTASAAKNAPAPVTA